MRRWGRSAFVATLVAATAAGCAEGRPGGGVATIDTLPSGVIHVANPAPGSSDPVFDLVEELRIGQLEGAGPDVFGEIWDLDVDRVGRIYVLDFLAKEVRAFDSNGTHLWSAGRSGEGPGELSYPVGIFLDERGRVWTVDAGNGRYTIFEDGEFVEERPRDVTSGIVPWVGGFDPTGRLWESFGFFDREVDQVGVVGLDEDLRSVDSLVAGPVEERTFATPVGERIVRSHIPFTPWITWKFDSRGYLFVGDASEYEIRQLTLQGDTVRVFRLEHAPLRVLAEELDSALAGLQGYRERGGRVDRSLIPGEKPGFQGIYIGTDGRVWSLLHVAGDALSPGPDEARFDVFTPDGVHLGVAHSGSRIEPWQPPPVFTATHMYATAIDDLGVQRVVRFRIEAR